MGRLAGLMLLHELSLPWMMRAHGLCHCRRRTISQSGPQLLTLTSPSTDRADLLLSHSNSLPLRALVLNASHAT